MKSNRLGKHGAVQQGMQYISSSSAYSLQPDFNSGCDIQLAAAQTLAQG